MQITYVDGQERRTVREVKGVRTFRIDLILESQVAPRGFRLRDERPFLQAIEDAGNRL